MVVYFLHQLSDSYVDFSDLYVVLSDLYFDLCLKLFICPKINP